MLESFFGFRGEKVLGFPAAAPAFAYNTSTLHAPCAFFSWQVQDSGLKVQEFGKGLMFWRGEYWVLGSWDFEIDFQISGIDFMI